VIFIELFVIVLLLFRGLFHLPDEVVILVDSSSLFQG